MITVPLIDWKPIAAIPDDRKDGRPILITDGEGLYAVVTWDAHALEIESHEGIGWRDMGDLGWGGTAGHAPTHWADINPPK